MRLIERRRAVKRARTKAEAIVSKAVASAFGERFKTLKRDLRRSNLRKRLKKHLSKQDTFGPGEAGWDEWGEYFVDLLTEALMEGAGLVGSIENQVWTSRGFAQFIIDREKIVTEYQNRTGKQIKNIADDTRDAVLEDIHEWYNTDAGLPDLIASLEQYFSHTRAELIATTEMGYVASEVALEQMQEYGISRWIWDAFDDFLTCEFCASMHGQVFAVGEEMPPDASHPRCRCGVLFADENGMELMVKGVEDIDKLAKWAEDTVRDEKGH
jgi:SPP1 gp7 family putative phage head morphogenesis protein